MPLQIQKHQLIAGVFFTLFWVEALTNFFICEMFQTFETPAFTLVYLMAEITLPVLALCTLRARRDIIIIAIGLILTFADTVMVNHLPIAAWLNGLRLYVCFLFVVPIIRYFFSTPELREYFVARMDRTLYLVLAIQFPLMSYQCALYGAYDNVGGSFGWSQSGVISTFIYLISFYLMVRRWDYSLSYRENLGRNWVLLFLLIPSFMNETKISFVFFLLYFLLLVPMNRNFGKVMLRISPFILLGVVGSGFLYTKMVGDDHQVEVSDLNDYVMGTNKVELVELFFEYDMLEIGESDMARGLLLSTIPTIMDREHIWLTGAGIGQLKGGNGMKSSEFKNRYFWFFQGTVMQLPMILVELGIPGVVLYFLFWLQLMNLFPPGHGGRDRRLTWMLSIVLLLVSFYNVPLYNPAFYMPVIYLAFICGCSRSLPPYRHIPLLGNRKFTFSLK